MFCKETSIMSTKTGAAIQVLPIPYANFSCFNDEIWEAKLAGITIEAVIKSTVLFLMSFATVSVNLIFLMVLRSPKYQRCVQVQVKIFLKIFFSASFQISTYGFRLYYSLDKSGANFELLYSEKINLDFLTITKNNFFKIISS